MRLLRVELTRLRWRRAVQLLVLAALVLPAFLWAAITWETRPVSDEQIAEARALAQESQRYQLDEIRACEDDPETYLEGWGAEPEATCAEVLGMPGDPDEEYVHYLERQPLTFQSLLEDTGVAAAVLVAVMMLLAGATFSGADWASGSMSNQLLFESNRTKVWLAKGGAVVIAALAASVVALGLYWALSAATLSLRDVDVTGSEWSDAGWQVLRSCLVATAAALGGFALTTLFRNTIATLGLLVALTIGSSLLIQALPFNEPEAWMLHANALALIQDGYWFWPSAPVACIDPMGMCLAEVPLERGLAYFGVVLVVTLVASLVSFRRRDVP